MNSFAHWAMAFEMSNFQQGKVSGLSRSQRKEYFIGDNNQL